MTDIKRIPQHEAMDTILKYLIDNKSDRPIHSQTIWKDVFPDQDEEVTYFLLRKIMGTEDQIVVTHIRSMDTHNFEVFFEANAITQKYLVDLGGFTKQYEVEQRAKVEQERLGKLQTEKLESEVDIIKFQKGLGKRLTIWGVLLTALSIVVSFLTGLFQVQPYQDQNSKVDSLTHVISLTTQQVDALTDSIQSLNSRLQIIELKTERQSK